MGMLDNFGTGIVGQLAGQFGGDQRNNKLVGAAAKLIGSSSVGGLGGLTQLFAQHGQGDKVNSWLSTDQNRDISPNELQDVLGSDRIRQVANDAGMSEQEASQGLSSMLPQLVDKMTPDGKMPEGNQANGMLSQLASQFLGNR